MPELRDRLAHALGSEYELGPEIGRGGMGVVYRATDLRLQRDVAVKILPPDLSYRDELRARFVRESQLAAGLNHPNIVPIHDVGDREGLVWYVMTFVEGESVRARVERDGPLTGAQTRRIIREVAWALGYAHARGIVHRDIKPDNILVERGTGRALVTDFGIAKIAEDPIESGTTPGMVMGSLMYMAPEQATGEAIDRRADIYSLGLSGYFMLSGRAPFEGSTVVSVASRVVTGATPDWDAIEPPIDPPLQTLLERCTEADPELRWNDAEDILEALGPQAVAPLPMPAEIRRLVRDFMLVPTLGFIILVVSIVTEDPSLPEFVGWMAVILTVNFSVTLGKFTERGFGWSHLRDGLEMEIARQAEELEETGALKRRFSAVVHIATWAGIATELIQFAIAQGFEPLLPIALGMIAIAGVIQYPLAWLQIKIFSFLGRLLLKVLPSLPRPETGGWISRLADRILAKLFRPFDLQSRTRAVLATETTGWRASEVGAARRDARSIDDVFNELPRELRDTARPVRNAALELTAAIGALRQNRDVLERQNHRELETYRIASRQASAALEKLRESLDEFASGEAGAERLVHDTLERARLVLDESRALTGGTLPQPSGSPLRPAGWLGVRLGAVVDGPGPDGTDDPQLHGLAAEITNVWSRNAQLQTVLPEGEETVLRLTQRVRELEASRLLDRQRGRPDDGEAAATITQCEMVLGRLLEALRQFEDNRTDTAEIESLLGRVRAVESKIDQAVPPQ